MVSDNIRRIGPAPEPREPTPVFEESEDYQALRTQVALLVEAMRYQHWRIDQAEGHIAWVYQHNNIEKPWQGK